MRCRQYQVSVYECSQKEIHASKYDPTGRRPQNDWDTLIDALDMLDSCMNAEQHKPALVFGVLRGLMAV